MKIFLPNAKELNTNLDNQPFSPLSAYSQPVGMRLASLSTADLANFYKISEERAQLEADRWERIRQGQAKSYPAFKLYDGLMYRYMNRYDLTGPEEAYLAEHVRIATGLYGLISPFELISPHRLDFQGNLEIEGKSLKQYWREQYDSLVEEDELLISLLSSEFEQVFSPRIQKKLVRIVFVEEKNGQYKVHSTISKKGRGRLVSLMAQEQITDLNELINLEFDGFHYAEHLSQLYKIVFVREKSK
ncbi:TPA: peroxide stress protein YaaA [Streptococcus suis]